MPTEIYLVKVGMNMTEGVVDEWYVPDGGTVQQGELLYRLETEKVSLDVDAEASGTVRHAVGEGVTMKPGDVVGYIYAEGEPIPDAPPPATPAEAGRAAAAADRSPERESAAPAPADGGRRPSSPAARRLARELGVELASLSGSGPGGRIVEADVRAAADRIAEAQNRASAPADRAIPVRGTIPVRGMRRTIAARMYRSLQTTAQLTMDMDVVMDAAVALRTELVEAWQHDGVRPSYTDFVIRAVAKALEQHPRMNATFGDTEITLHGAIHVGLAVALDDGLVVPVIRDANRLPLAALARESARLAGAARDGRLGLDDLQGATFTISPLGMFGVDSFTPILNAPQVGILGVNRIRDDVAWDGDRPQRQQRMMLSLTWDHRALDGAPAARFLAAVRDLLESPLRLLC